MRLRDCFVYLGLLSIFSCNIIRIRREGVSLCRDAALRAALVSTFQDTVSYCFKSTLETMGSSVRDVVYDHLRKRGIPESEIPAQFDDVVRVLNESFGGSARVIVYKTLVELYQQYSMRVDFTYQESLRDHMSCYRRGLWWIIFFLGGFSGRIQALRGDCPSSRVSCFPTLVDLTILPDTGNGLRLVPVLVGCCAGMAEWLKRRPRDPTWIFVD